MLLTWQVLTPFVSVLMGVIENRRGRLGGVAAEAVKALKEQDGGEAGGQSAGTSAVMTVRRLRPIFAAIAPVWQRRTSRLPARYAYSGSAGAVRATARSSSTALRARKTRTSLGLLQTTDHKMIGMPSPAAWCRLSKTTSPIAIIGEADASGEALQVGDGGLGAATWTQALPGFAFAAG